MNQDDDIEQLGEYMHNLGDILYFHEDPVLRDFVIIKPTWGLDAVYKLLDNKQTEERLGKFNYKDLRQLWNDPNYENYHAHLLRLMANFQLCYQLPTQDDTYIAPQLLGEDPPHYSWDEVNNVQLRYEYPVFMPRGVLSRSIVKLHNYIEEQRLVWRSGVILRDDYARAELLELRGQKQIRIRVSGSNKRDLLMQIVRALDELHQSFPRLQFNRLVPCNCESCLSRQEPHFYKLDSLRERLANRTDTIECQKPPYRNVPIHGMLSDITIWKQQIEEKGDTIFNFGNIYRDNHFEGHSSAMIAFPQANISQQLASTINIGEGAAILTDTERDELNILEQQKEAIEYPLRKWAQIIKYTYIFVYAACIPLLWWGLTRLVEVNGWDKFEPISWVASMVFILAGPLLVWLSPETFKPANIEQCLFKRWRTRNFAKYAFDSDRYQQLLELSRAISH